MLDRILCVDDDPITLMLCKKVIIKSSFSNEIITAQNGEEALIYFNTIRHAHNNKSNEQPQLIFLDLNMPVMGGWEFLDHFSSPEFSEFHTTVKVVVLSSTIDPEDLEKTKQYPIVIDFLSKPITRAMLDYLKTKFE